MHVEDALRRAADRLVRATQAASLAVLSASMRMPGVSGLDLQHRLPKVRPQADRFLAAHGDIPMSVQAMKAGAVDFLTNPVRDQTLLDAVAAASRAISINGRGRAS